MSGWELLLEKRIAEVRARKGMGEERRGGQQGKEAKGAKQQGASSPIKRVSTFPSLPLAFPPSLPPTLPAPRPARPR